VPTKTSATLRFSPSPDASEIEAVRSLVAEHAGSVTWVESTKYERTYGLVEDVDAACMDALRLRSRAAVFDRPIIALAVVPNAPEALPALLDALGGRARPSGVIGCERCAGGLVVEWDLDETGIDVVMNLIDVETARFRAARVNALLTPLPLRWWTRIAAEGLRAPEISPDRVLEEQLEVHGVLD
jgi:hypothetical protein